VRTRMAALGFALEEHADGFLARDPANIAVLIKL
jgi:hypothetical protein